jgi:hypothetical protein
MRWLLIADALLVKNGCKLCFHPTWTLTSKGSEISWRNRETKLLVLPIRQNATSCDGCRFLTNAIKQCEEKLHNTINFQHVVICLATDHQSFSRCIFTTSSEGTVYEFIFGYHGETPFPANCFPYRN